MPQVIEKRLLAVILALYALLATTYALVTPVFEASDELWHYPMIRHLADGNPLPVQVFDPAQAGPWKQEASQPPLYYYLGAALTFWIDASDMEQARWENPHVDNGVITADGNVNLVVHDPAFNPWQGTLLAVRVVRLFSVLLGAATVYLTFRIATEVVPDRPEITLGAAAVVAFTPMFLFISGAINNDNLIVPLAALALLLMIRMVSEQYTVNSKQYTVHCLLLGVVIGLASLTKLSGVGLLALAWGTIVMTRWQAAGREVTLLGLVRWSIEATLHWLLVLLPALLIAGWWYYRNVVLYGDWRGWTAFIAVLGQRAHPADLAQLWSERWGFLLSYWGLFGGVNVPMWTWIYHVLNVVLVVSVIGFVIYLLREIGEGRVESGEWRVNLHSLISNLLLFVERHFALVICLLWSAAVVYGIVDWARTTWSSQGRLVFSALSALTILMVVGLVGWLPRRPARQIMVGLALLMLAVAAAAPFLWIRPAYQPNSYYPPRPYVLTPARVEFADKMRLTGMAVQAPLLGTSSVRPGEFVDVVLAWEVLAPMERNWSVFVHLNDPVLDWPIAQRDMYHAQGLRPTSLLAPGEQLVTYYRLVVPETAVAPAQLELAVGLYDFYSDTNERLPLASGRDTATLAVLTLEPVPGDYPNQLSANFENRLELVGYELRPRRAQPGDRVELDLYWRAQRPLAADYTFFAQVVNLEDLNRWGSQDLPVPTASWLPGEVQKVSLAFSLSEETPAGVYPVIVGAYTTTAEGNFDRLRVVTEDGRLTQDDFLRLTPLRVDR